MNLQIFLLVLISTLWIGYEIWLVIRDAARGKGKTATDKGTRYINFIAIWAGITIAVILSGFSKFFFPGGRTSLAFLIGIAIMLAGLALRVWSIATLGASFRTTVETHGDQKMIDHGPYRLVRHPSYTGLIIICCGFGIALQNWLSLLIVVILPLSALLYRIHVEEPALIFSFGSDYIEYQKRTKKLVPWLW
jgi:protein-S-isoprenylcysteine O-methyltransferase Ste14